MGLWIAGGVIAAGALTSAFGASQNASAQKDAYRKIRKAENKFAKKWQENLDTYIDAKEDKLYDLGNIFDRFKSTGAFGDTNTLDNLRQAQEDFSALAAGDFTAFESQLRKTLSDSLQATVGSGSPIGAYAGLAADAMLDYRQQGLQTAMSTTEFLSNESNKLLGLEFGVMDQRFSTSYELDRNRLTNVNNARLGAAATAGASLTAFGNAAQQIGSLAFGGITNQQNNQQLLDMQQQNQQFQLQMAQSRSLQQPTYSSYIPPVTNSFAAYPSSYQSPSFPTNFSSYPDGIATQGYPMVLPPRNDVYSAPASSGTPLSNYYNQSASRNALSSIGARIAAGG